MGGGGGRLKSVIDDINNPTKRLPINSTKLGGRFFRGKATLRFSTFQKYIMKPTKNMYKITRKIMVRIS